MHTLVMFSLVLRIQQNNLYRNPRVEAETAPSVLGEYLNLGLLCNVTGRISVTRSVSARVIAEAARTSALGRRRGAENRSRRLENRLLKLGDDDLSQPLPEEVPLILDASTWLREALGGFKIVTWTSGDACSL